MSARVDRRFATASLVLFVLAVGCTADGLGGGADAAFLAAGALVAASTALYVRDGFRQVAENARDRRG